MFTPKFMLPTRLGRNPVGTHPVSLPFPRLARSTAVLAAGLAFATTAGAVNVLENGDFEGGWANWTVVSPVNWNTYIEHQTPTHSGNLIFKVYGCWCGDPNLEGIYQDVPSGPGSTYTAGGWIIAPSSDSTANAGWLEVNFLSASGAVLARYQSAHLTAASPKDSWDYYPVTNQVAAADAFGTNVIATVSSLVAPAGTVKVRFWCQHEQIANGGGAIWFDDVDLNQTGGNRPPTITSIAPNDATALFNPAANGFTFKASSATTNINASGITVILNGLDVSSSLVITGPANDHSVAYNGLKSNRVYSAAITVVDAAGFTKAAAVIFDTFLPGNFIWEAEDYDFGGGQYINNPVVTSTNYANSYFGQKGVDEVDFHDPVWGGNSAQAYRGSDVPGPGTEWCLDVPRQKYIDAYSGGDTNVHDYDLGWTYGNDTAWTGDWANYTRNFPAGTYNLYGRLSGGGGASKVAIYKVTAGTTSPVGEFRWNSHGYQAYDFVPLTDASGNLVSVTLSGVTTLRVMGANANQNFFMLAPARDDLPLISNLYPSGHLFEPTNTLAFKASSAVATIPTNGIYVTLNGLDVTSLLTIGSNATNRSVSLAGLALNAIYTATISVSDSASTVSTRTIKFDTFSESNLMFEAEDYDFDNGKYISNPVLSTTLGTNNYYNLPLVLERAQAIEGVDISTNYPSGGYANLYGRGDIIGTQAAMDYLRQAYVAAQVTEPGVIDYNVGWGTAGSWLNYTRSYPANNYWVYGRIASPGIIGARLDHVTAGAGTPNQTLVAVGDFTGTANGWQDWIWAPVLDGSGKPASVALSGVTTLRVNNTTGNMNGGYYMLIPAKTSVKMTCAKVGGNISISIPTQAGPSYTVFYKNSLQDAAWKLLTIIQGNGATKSYTDTSASGSQRYYRCLIQ